MPVAQKGKSANAASLGRRVECGMRAKHGSGGRTQAAGLVHKLSTTPTGDAMRHGCRGQIPSPGIAGSLGTGSPVPLKPRLSPLEKQRSARAGGKRLSGAARRKVLSSPAGAVSGGRPALPVRNWGEGSDLGSAGKPRKKKPQENPRGNACRGDLPKKAGAAGFKPFGWSKKHTCASLGSVAPVSCEKLVNPNY